MQNFGLVWAFFHLHFIMLLLMNILQNSNVFADAGKTNHRCGYYCFPLSSWMLYQPSCCSAGSAPEHRAWGWNGECVGLLASARLRLHGKKSCKDFHFCCWYKFSWMPLQMVPFYIGRFGMKIMIHRKKKKELLDFFSFRFNSWKFSLSILMSKTPGL